MYAHAHTCVCVCVCVQSLICVHIFVTPWTVAHQPPLSMRFSRQENLERVAISSIYIEKYNREVNISLIMISLSLGNVFGIG